MSGTLTWIGSDDIFEQPGSPQIKLTGSGSKTILTYRGPFTALEAAAPALGATVAGSLGKVEDVDIRPDGAGINGPGTMIVTLAEDQVTYEIESAGVEKPLERHPIYATGGTKALTEDDLDKVAAWKNANNAAERATAYTACSANAQHFVDKLRRGQEAYLLAAPVAKKTSRSFAKPATEATGKRGAPAGFPDLPAGYQWLKTADRAVKQGVRGSWERVEEWQAADAWDTDIYEAAV